MDALQIIIIGFLIAIIVKKIKYYKKIEVLTSKTKFELIFVVLGICIFMTIIYKFSNNLVGYILGIIGSIAFVLNWYVQGLSEDGFISNGKAKDLIKWNEIEEIIINNSTNGEISLTLIGEFIDPIFRFKKNDVSRVQNIIIKNKALKTKLIKK